MGCNGALEGASGSWVEGERTLVDGLYPGTDPRVTRRSPPCGGLRPGSVGRWCYLDLLGTWQGLSLP